MAEKDVANKPAHVVYKEKMEPFKGHVGMATPKNLRQIQTMCAKQDSRLTKNTIINIHGNVLDDPWLLYLIYLKFLAKQSTLQVW